MKIVNPLTNEKVDLLSNDGKDLLKNYIINFNKQYGKGEVVEVNNNLTDDASIINKDAEKDGWILENISNIQNIPGIIIQGRYDVVCPMKSAWDLNKVWNKSELIIVPNSGHSMLEKEIQKKLIEVTKRYENY